MSLATTSMTGTPRTTGLKDRTCPIATISEKKTPFLHNKKTTESTRPVTKDHAVTLDPECAILAQGISKPEKIQFMKTASGEERSRIQLTHSLANQKELIRAIITLVSKDTEDGNFAELYPVLSKEIASIVKGQDLTGFEFIYNVFAKRVENSFKLPLEYTLDETDTQVLTIARDQKGYAYFTIDKRTGERVQIKTPTGHDTMIANAKEQLEINVTKRQNVLNDMKKLESGRATLSTLSISPVILPDISVLSIAAFEERPYTFAEQAFIIQHIRTAAANLDLPIPRLKDLLFFMIYKNDQFGTQMVMGILNDRATRGERNAVLADQALATKLMEKVGNVLETGLPPKDIIAGFLRPGSKEYLLRYEEVRGTPSYQELKKEYSPLTGYGRTLIQNGNALQAFVQREDEPCPEEALNMMPDPTLAIILMAETGDTQGLLDMNRYLNLCYEAIKKERPNNKAALERCQKNLTVFYEITQSYYNAYFPSLNENDIPLKSSYSFEKQNALTARISTLLQAIAQDQKNTKARSELKRRLTYLKAKKDTYIIDKLSMVLHQNAVEASRLYGKDGRHLYYLQADEERKEYVIKKTDKNNADLELTQEDAPAINELKARFLYANQLYLEFQGALK